MKVPDLVAYAQDLEEQGNSVVLFVNFRDTVVALCEQLNCKAIQGGQTVEERQAIVDEFQNDKSTIVVANIAAGGTGLSLHDCNGDRPRVSLICPSFNAKDYLQTLGRIHRNGAKSDAIEKSFSYIRVYRRKCYRLNERKMIKINNLAELTWSLIHPIHQMSNQPDQQRTSPSSLKYVAGCSGYEGRSGTNAAAEKGTRIHEALEVRDPSALHDEDEVMIYEAIVKQEDEYTKNYAKGQEYKEENEILLDVDLDSTNTWGTCDRLLTFGNKAILADYKTGVSEIDPPRSNWQARAYTVGAFQKYPELDEITFVFYIPVRNEVLEGTFTREELPLLVKQLADVIRNGEKVRPQWDGGFPEADALSPSVNCRFCKHEEYCPSLGGLAVEIVQRISGDNLPKENIEDPNDPETVEHLYVVAKVVENWAKRVKEKL